MTQTTPTRDEAVRKIQSECDACFGVGRVEDPASSLVLGGFKDCPDCKGSGWVWKEYAASAPAHASGGVDAVAVKALDWSDVFYQPWGEPPELTGWEAEGVAGYYNVTIEHSGFEVDLDGVGHFKIGTFDDPDAAKAAAQADYEQRIRSALSPAATPVSEAGGERNGYISADNGQGMGLPERCTRYHCGGEIRYEPTVSYSDNGDNLCTKCGASYGSDA